MLYIGSYGHRYCDPIGAIAGRSLGVVEDALEEAIKYESEELRAYCEHTGNPDTSDSCNAGGDCPECEEYGECSLCDADIVSYGIWPVSTIEDLGGIRNARGVIGDLRTGSDVVHFGEGTY